MATKSLTAEGRENYDAIFRKKRGSLIVDSVVLQLQHSGKKISKEEALRYRGLGKEGLKQLIALGLIEQ